MRKVSELKQLLETGTDEYIHQIAKYPLLSEKEFRELLQEYRQRKPQARSQARRKIIEGNLQLVLKVARRYLAHGEAVGLDYSDLIEEGSIGLMRALEKYNPRKHARFSTYANYWIEEYIRRAIARQAHVIRIPFHIQGRLRAWRQKYQKLTQKLGRFPTAQEVAAELKLNDAELSQLLADLWISLPQKSLENPVSEDGSLVLEDVIEDDDLSVNPQEQTQRIKQEVSQMLMELPAADRKLLTWRYGLNNTPAHSLAEIGRKLKISRERVRQLLERALRRLRKVMAK